jgi:hypothetical protein
MSGTTRRCSLEIGTPGARRGLARCRHSPGHAYYQKKLAEGKTGEEALRALKRQISDAIYACLQAGAQRATARMKSPGGQPGNGSDSSAVGSHPGHRLFGQATPGPATYPTTPTASVPAPLPSQASGRTGQGPGAARPRQRRQQGVLDPAAREPTMPAAGRKATGPADHRSALAPSRHRIQHFRLDGRTKRCSICTGSIAQASAVGRAHKGYSGSYGVSGLTVSGPDECWRLS